MANAESQQAASRRAGVLGVHSVNRFVFPVPKLDEAEQFYTAFGARYSQDQQPVGPVHAGPPPLLGFDLHNGAPKKLQYVSFGVFAEDLEVFRARIEKLGIGCEPHPLSDGSGLWLRNPDGTPMQLVVAPKVSPSAKSEPAIPPVVAPGQGAAPSRSAVKPVRPRHLSHILLFTPDVPRMVRFCTEALGLRLSDKSLDIIAFMHGVHGSDHHLVAFAKSHGPGLHHSSWDVGSIDEVGCGAEQLERTATLKAGA